MAHFLHYAGSTFELPDAQAALDLMRDIQLLKQHKVAGRLHVTLKEPGRVVYIFISESTDVAISGAGDPNFANVGDEKSGVPIF